MKTNLRKIISMLIAAAIVLSSGFTAIPKPATSPSNGIVIEAEEPNPDEAQLCQPGGEEGPGFDEPEVEILQ